MTQILLNQIRDIEKYWKFPIPNAYQNILLEQIQEHLIYEIEYFDEHEQEEIYICFYNCFDLIERNQTYHIQTDEPHFLMVGQQGDLGYFISNHHNDLTLYQLDLGALGSRSMHLFVTDFRSLFHI
ncbi:SMI1/KNR4 family protein [Acinetobacter sp. CFCC 10889]|uniref:SMI1/KNR4 family protein n=1 Tax=Acinetobacter sp. CFCC 10889 TaxID=1775557 RepID=UPI000DD025CA|nr:SMI1/KNR4 family protein [Acinetobacter sp. CFCC 10889]